MGRMFGLTHPLQKKLREIGVDITLEQSEEIIKDMFDIILRKLDGCERVLITKRVAMEKVGCNSKKPHIIIRDLRKEKPGK